MDDEMKKATHRLIPAGVIVTALGLIYLGSHLRSQKSEEPVKPTNDQGIESTLSTDEMSGMNEPIGGDKLALDDRHLDPPIGTDPNVGAYGYLNGEGKIVYYCWDGQFAEQGPNVKPQPGWGLMDLADPKLRDRVAWPSLEDALTYMKGTHIVRLDREEPTLIPVDSPNVDGLRKVYLEGLYKLRQNQRDLKLKK